MSAAHHGASGGGPPSIPPFIAAAVNHELTQIKIVTIVFLIAGGVAALFRAYVRICMLRKVGADDWVMLIAFIFFVIDNTLTLVNVDAQRPFFTGQPMTTSVSTLLLNLRWESGLYTLTVLLIKISTGLSILRLYANGARIQKAVIWVLTGISSLLGFVFFIFAVATCGIGFGSSGRVSTCGLQTAFDKVSLTWSILNAVNDIVFAALAILLLWGMQLGRATKISAGALLLVGTVGGVASCLRVAVFLGWEGQDGPLVSKLRVGTWSQFEQGLCMLAACAMTLRPLLRQVFDKCGLTKALSSMTTPAKRPTMPAKALDAHDSELPRGISTLETQSRTDSDIEKNSIFARTTTTVISDSYL